MELADENPKIEMCTRAPGVFFEEITPPLERELRTGIPLIAGFSEWLDDSSGVKYRLSPDSDKESNVRVLKLTSWEGARNRIGAVDNEGFLDYAVRGFFENGGRKCIVDRAGRKIGNAGRTSFFYRMGLCPKMQRCFL